MLKGVSLLMLSHLTSYAPFIQYYQYTLDKLRKDNYNFLILGGKADRQRHPCAA